MTHGLGEQAWVGVGTPGPGLLTAPAPTSGPRAKPSDGFFTSTFDGSRRSSPWLDLCRSDAFTRPPRRGECLWTFDVEEDALLYVVDSQDDFRRLAEFVPQRYNNRRDPRYAPDWNRLARREPLPFDGVHVTAKAIADATGQAAVYPEFSGWDIESTLWLVWRLRRPRCVGRITGGWRLEPE